MSALQGRFTIKLLKSPNRTDTARAALVVVILVAIEEVPGPGALAAALRGTPIVVTTKTANRCPIYIQFIQLIYAW